MSECKEDKNQNKQQNTTLEEELKDTMEKNFRLDDENQNNSANEEEEDNDVEKEEEEDDEKKTGDKPNDDLIDEEKLKLEEEGLSEEQLNERLKEAKDLKDFGNAQFKNDEFKPSVLSYTQALLICPLKEKELRAILYSNRAASKVKLELKETAIQDCTSSLEHNPTYMKPLIRRAKLYEETDKLDEALADYKKIVELDPSNSEAQYALQRLPGQINERNEKLKEEMLGKLKELGNMVLRPFGLSTNNFQLQQDPSSGSYSVNFKK